MRKSFATITNAIMTHHITVLNEVFCLFLVLLNLSSSLFSFFSAQVSGRALDDPFAMRSSHVLQSFAKRFCSVMSRRGFGVTLLFCVYTCCYVTCIVSIFPRPFFKGSPSMRFQCIHDEGRHGHVTIRITVLERAGITFF